MVTHPLGPGYRGRYSATGIMKVGTRLRKSLAVLADDVMPLADTSIDDFVSALRNWWQHYLAAVARHNTHTVALSIIFLSFPPQNFQSRSKLSNTAVINCRDIRRKNFLGQSPLQTDW